MRVKLCVHFIVLATLTGCAAPQEGVSEEDMWRASGKIKNGSWTNLYKGDPNLAGALAQQFPDGDDGFSFEERNGKHPCMVLYGFWDDRFRQMHYTPTGELENEFWFTIDDSTSWIWNNVDFTKGSDPEFKIHPDPRVRWADLRKQKP